MSVVMSQQRAANKETTHRKSFCGRNEKSLAFPCSQYIEMQNRKHVYLRSRTLAAQWIVLS